MLVCHVKDFPICLSVLVSIELSYWSTHVEVNVHDVNMYIILYSESLKEPNRDTSQMHLLKFHMLTAIALHSRVLLSMQTS